MPRLLSAISPHGFGHLAQTAPVVNALRRRLPQVELIVRTTVPEYKLRGRIEGAFELQPEGDDFGMSNPNALEVDAAASAELYRRFHADWEQKVEVTAEALAASGADLVLADVPYLTLAAAARAGIPAIALCSLHWGEIFWHYCAEFPEAERIHGEILAAYRSAQLFLTPAPSMPMAGLDNLLPIGPIALAGRNRREELRARYALDGSERLVMVAMGGIAFRPPMERWPVLPGLRWIVQADWEVARPDVLVVEELGIPYVDALASSDALLTKPGYGAFTEAAVSGIPVLSVQRDGWPEEPYLVQWLERQNHGRLRRLSRQEFEQGAFIRELPRFLELGGCSPVAPTGIEEAAVLIESLLSAKQDG